MNDLRKAAEMALGVLLDPKTRADEVAEAVKVIRQALDLQNAIEKGTKAWADVPNASKWVDELRGNDKPPVKSYCGGVPNYCTPEQEPVYAFRRKGLDDFCTCDKRRYDELAGKPNLFEVTVFYTAPVDAVNISAERVDETAKGEHDLWIAAACLKSTVEAAIKAGDWKVDGACDPTMDLQYLANCFSSIQNREWVGLTDEEIKKIAKKHKWHDGNVEPHLMPVFRSLESKLKEKNGG